MSFYSLVFIGDGRNVDGNYVTRGYRCCDHFLATGYRLGLMCVDVEIYRSGKFYAEEYSHVGETIEKILLLVSHVHLESVIALLDFVDGVLIENLRDVRVHK